MERAGGKEGEQGEREEGRGEKEGGEREGGGEKQRQKGEFEEESSLDRVWKDRGEK